jgi:hypothetical protein
MARHFKTQASSDTDTTLSLALKQFDAQNDKNYILRDTLWSVFRIDSEFLRKWLYGLNVLNVSK